jgi:hypothetical protein
MRSVGTVAKLHVKTAFRNLDLPDKASLDRLRILYDWGHATVKERFLHLRPHNYAQHIQDLHTVLYRFGTMTTRECH